MDPVVISERRSMKSTGTRAAVDVDFDNTKTTIITGIEVQTALEQLDFAVSQIDVDELEDQIDAVAFAAAAAQNRADAAYELAEEAMAATAAGGEVFAFFLS